MKTDDLINMLASGPDVSAPKLPVLQFAVMIAGGLLLSIILMLVVLGLRPNLGALAMLPAFWIKMAFVLALAASGWLAVTRLSAPGARIKKLPWLIALPILLIWIIAGISMMKAAPEQRAYLFWGDTWHYCSWLIAILSLPILVAILKVMRQLAPTRLRLAGAGAGFAAGTAATLVYSFHCPEIAAPFIGFWYLIGILIPSVIGVIIGPRVLRW
ncbi:NrsF family protein [Herminiimonas glaciei]|uniref:NrsF family protein n=1 Tax=Herminiimonas glaciei TaxID=523788 RepID=A0ABW2IDI5_9BURK